MIANKKNFQSIDDVATACNGEVRSDSFNTVSDFFKCADDAFAT